MKAGALNDGGASLVYRGSLVFRRDSLGMLSFESALIAAGRITAGGVRYHVTDHLGSVRAVVDGATGDIVEVSDYAAYGERLEAVLPDNFEPVVTPVDGYSFRYHFTGQEDQGPVSVTVAPNASAATVPYTDFGARHYSPALRRWLVPDPLNEQYYDVSSYAYCAGDPVNCFDPNGRRPIYSIYGYLLGTDDNGLQGDAIIMDSQFFRQGMSPDDAQKYNLGLSALVDPDALLRFNESFYNLSSRPDWDGYLTLKEANDWYRNGKGQSLFVSLEKIDLSGLVSLGDEYVGQERYINLFWGSHSLNDAMVYGNIKLVRYPYDMVRAKADYYDFDMKPWISLKTIGRNIETVIGKKVAKNGVGYKVHIYGSKQLKSISRPWVR